MKYLFISTALLFSFSVNAEECSKLMVINNDNIKAIYSIEHAKTAQQRKIGLMNRKHMDENQGMLFTWDKPDFRAMWMKNTYIPLDMIFINNNKVIGIVENTVPHSLTPRYIQEPVNQILEINAQQAQKNSIAIGDTVKCK